MHNALIIQPLTAISGPSYHFLFWFDVDHNDAKGAHRWIEKMFGVPQPKRLIGRGFRTGKEEGGLLVSGVRGAALRFRDQRLKHIAISSFHHPSIQDSVPSAAGAPLPVGTIILPGEEIPGAARPAAKEIRCYAPRYH